MKNGRYEEDGNVVWYKNDVIHRDNDLPAIKRVDGTKHWFKNGQRHRDNDLPAIELSNGTKHWFINGQHHRDNDLPAIERANGSKYWFQNGQRHRETGPAVLCVDVIEEWFIHNNEITNLVPDRDNWRNWTKFDWAKFKLKFC